MKRSYSSSLYNDAESSLRLIRFPTVSGDQSREGLGAAESVRIAEVESEEIPITVSIEPEWLHSAYFPIISVNNLCMNISPGLKFSALYAPEDVQSMLHHWKSLLSQISPIDFYSARSRSNPFDLIKSEMFQNRSALKIAELDKVYNRLFTLPPCYNKDRELFQFGDICGGPGGFSEYQLLIHKWRGKGYGFTLKSSNDFETAQFNHCSNTQSFKSYYGDDGTGDITISDNIRSFIDDIWLESDGLGLHVVMGDGGFSVEGEERNQEFLSQQLILCQTIVALSTLRKGGIFVCKFFDTFLPFTINILYLLRVYFDAFSIIKLNQSRPANSEKYIVANGLREKRSNIIMYLLKVNDKINELRMKREICKSELSAFHQNHLGEEELVTSFIPDDIIKLDEPFIIYINELNIKLANKQVSNSLHNSSYKHGLLVQVGKQLLINKN